MRQSPDVCRELSVHYVIHSEPGMMAHRTVFVDMQPNPHSTESKKKEKK